MLKNKNVKKIIITSIILLILIVLVSTFFSFVIFKKYSNTLIDNNNRIIDYIVNIHPELEENIIKELLLDKKSNINYIEKYGIELNYITELKQIKNQIIIGNISIILVSIIVIMIFFLIYVCKEHKSLNKISNSINKVLNNDYSIDIKEYNDDYFSRLNNDVYKVMAELKEQRDISRKDKKYLEETLSDISHQLRTPLTSMYVINDLLETIDDDKKKKEFLSKNKNQLERIEWLVTSLLKLSRLESGSVILTKEKVNLYELIESSIDPVRVNLELKEISINNLIDKKTTINVDFNWTKEALVNIIKNAYEHTPNKGEIIIAATSNPLYTELIIKDNGCGIEKDKIPYIFDRFYKVDKDSDSIGIGLNMTKRIISEQLGDITVDSKVGIGTTFIIKFYKNVI